MIDARRRWWRVCRTVQANRPTVAADFPPALLVPAATTKAGWLPLTSGQSVPLLWERVPPEPVDECEDG